MAIGKSRGSKRPSGGSWSSTAAVLVLIFVSVFGDWMLTSPSITTPEKGSIVHKETSHFDSIHHNKNLPRKIPFDTTTVFEDNPGDQAQNFNDDLDLDQNSKQKDENTSGVLIETEHESEINPNIVETVNDRKQEVIKHVEEKTKPEERNAVPFKRHTKKMITAKKDIEKGRSFNTTTDKHTNLDEETSSKILNKSKNKWELCNVTAGMDYIPCLDNEKAINNLHGRNHYEHRERHCPEEGQTCLVPLPEGYKTPIRWPGSRNKIWFHNVPHKDLAKVKGHQNWVRATGEFLTFPGGGTQFVHGALHYIDFVQQMVPEIAWGKHTRVILDVGCGFALERGIPAISAVMGTQRLPFPSNVFDLVHCAHCRVPWHIEGGKLLLELNRVLRPGGYFVWSATPVYRKGTEDAQIWKEMSALTAAMCWELITIKKDKLNLIGVAVYQKPDSNECYSDRKHQEPPMCKPDDDSNVAWYIPLQTCMHKVPTKETERGSKWPEEWPARVQEPPYWLNKAPLGIYGKPTPSDFEADYEHWKRIVSNTYMSGLGVNWSNVRNVMDMRALYGGFAAALKDLKLWVMNVVNIDSPDTLPIIYERGLFGIYHDWCESFSTYPRTYDLLHADHLFSKLKDRCKTTVVITEVDRIVRPGGKLIIRDKDYMI
ncbi:hypothetical protein L1987_71421 [Smallanthus sonchifolius]|uniref:Uncharacterized protein n=1 Tax=Smallanthus sonchifolius TaxID=185202 RepID=A0ACB9AT11_9ASTR|nr:hypothetical protein L1987_71421 [Smallanthus sonchifolius]